MQTQIHYLQSVTIAHAQRVVKYVSLPKNLDDDQNNKVLVLVEPRAHPMLEAVVINHMRFLGDGWNLHIFTSAKNAKWVTQLFPTWKIRVTTLGALFENLTQESYSALLLSETFWQSIREEHILISQVDSIMLRDGIDPFLKYDYCGANYINQRHCAPVYGGIQGGFSLRRRSAMIRCVREVSWNDMQDYRTHGTREPIDRLFEDIYFTHACEMLGLYVPSAAERKDFAIESDYSQTPIGIHGTDKLYIPLEWQHEIVRNSKIDMDMSDDVVEVRI